MSDYCPHQFHCKECEERLVKVVRSWVLTTEALKKRILELEAELVVGDGK